MKPYETLTSVGSTPVWWHSPCMLVGIVLISCSACGATTAATSDLGDQTCSQFYADYKGDPKGKGRAYLMLADKAAGLSQQIDRSLQKSYLRKFCMENPDALYSSAVENMVNDNGVWNRAASGSTSATGSKSMPAPSPVESSVATANLIIYENFEIDIDDSWGRQGSTPGGFGAVKAPSTRAGGNAMRFVVEKSAPWVAGGPRTELFPRQIGYWLEGEEYWIGASILFPVDYKDDPMQEIVWQIHAASQGRDKKKPGAVPFLIQSVGDKLLIRGRQIRTVEVGKTKGEWMDIVVHHDWSSKGKNGTTQVWVNGELLVDANGIDNMVEGDRLYWKFGIYKSGWKQGSDARSVVDRRELWFDEVRIGGAGASYEAVAPR